MGRARNGANGSVSGKVGSVVYYSMYGKDYVRSLPDVRKDKPSPAKLRQRQRLSLVTAFLQPFKDLVRITFAHNTVGRSPYHTAQSLNMKNAISGDEYPNQEIDFSKVILSSGNLELPKKFSVKRKDNGLFFEWSDYDKGNLDTLVVIFFDKHTNYAEYQFTGVAKYKNSFLWDVDLNDEEVAVWIAFRKLDETDMSASLYLGNV